MSKKEKVDLYKLTITIFDALHESQFCTETTKSIENEVLHLSKCLNVSSVATCFFTLIFSYTIEDSDVHVKRLSRYLDLKPALLYQYKEAFDELLDHNLIEVVDEEERDFFFKCLYKVPDLVVKAVLENKDVIGLKSKEHFDIYQFLTNVFAEYVSRSLQNYTLLEFVMAISKLEKKHSSFKLPQKLKKLGLSTDERAIIYVLAKKLTTDEGSCNLKKLVRDFYDIGYCAKKMNEFISETTILQKNGLIKIPSSGYTDQISASLTEKAKKLIFNDDVSQFKNVNKSEFLNLIEADKIRPKQLFFNPLLKSELDFFKECISPQNLPRLYTKLKERNIGTCIISIFSGLPGSGKTAYAYQLAQELNYDLYVVDFTKMKSEYYSVSQKLVKQTFSEIRNICVQNERPVIVLFNEADALFHKRNSSNGNDSAVSQIENEIQNILLEELEDVPENSVYILTTNRMDCLDEALYRRLLFKIKFDAPDKEVMKQIFKSKIGVLNDDQISELVNRVQLTGGLIDNVVSKITMIEVINNGTPTFEQILEFCQSERATNVVRPRVGFN